MNVYFLVFPETFKIGPRMTAEELVDSRSKPHGLRFQGLVSLSPHHRHSYVRFSFLSFCMSPLQSGQSGIVATLATFQNVF